MKTKILLWLTVIVFTFHFGGHVFDILANQPNWKSGEISDISKYRDFYVKTSPKNYFAFIVLGGPVISLISLVLVWKVGNRTKFYFGLSFLIAVIVLIFTGLFFVPINEYIFTTMEYDPVKLKGLVSKWIAMEYIRVILLAVGMLTSILGLDSYLSREVPDHRAE